MAGLSRNVGFSQGDCRCMMSLDCQGCRITDTQSKYAVLIVETHPARPGAQTRCEYFGCLAVNTWLPSDQKCSYVVSNTIYVCGIII